MFGKLFASMYDGSLRTRSPWQALVTFQQLIVLANKDGEVDMTAESLSLRTGIPLEIINLGLRSLEAPDPDSRTPAEEGRRILRLDPERSWGWRIVNYDHYRKIRSSDERREYMRLHMRAKRAKEKESAGTVSDVSPPLAPVSNVSQGSKQYAVSSMHSSSSAEESELAGRMPTDLDRNALVAVLDVAPTRVAWCAEMLAALQGMHGAPLSPAQLAEALRDYVANGLPERPTLRHFRTYMQRAASLPSIPTGSRTNDPTIAALEKWKRDTDERERSA